MPKDHYTDLDYSESVAIEGNTIVAGAPQYSPGKTGEVYIFQYDPTENRLELRAKLRPHRIERSPLIRAFFGFGFGANIAFRGDTLLVQAKELSSNVLNSDNTVETFLFRRNSSSSRWCEQAKLLKNLHGGGYLPNLGVSSKFAFVGDPASFQSSKEERKFGAVYVFGLQSESP